MQGAFTRFLQSIETVGNTLPHPTVLFVYLCFLMVALSAFFSAVGLQAVHPVTGAVVSAENLVSRDGLHWILANTVKNFTSFAPVGTVLVAILGLGIAEHSGLLSVALRSAVSKAPQSLLSFMVVLVGVLSSLAADAGYVVLIPLAGILFAASGRNPIAGIAAAFAGVSGGYSANLLIGPLDAVLAGISTEAAQLIRPDYEVNAAGNYYFIFISTFFIALVGTFVTEKIVAPRLPAVPASTQVLTAITGSERRGLRGVAVFTLLFIGLLVWGLLPENGLLRDAATGSILRSPFIQGIVTLISLYAGVAGLIFGKLSGTYAGRGEYIEGMEQSMGTMAGYLVLMFFAAQFVNYFGWSQLGVIAAIKGAAVLQTLQLSAATLLVSFILLAAFLNLLIGSASAKWALIAPVFIPMLLLNGISPEAAQVAYRVGDSSTNIITPLMPYFGVVIAFVQRYDKDAGIGTIVATMLPYSIAFLLGWSLLLAVWVVLGWPLGPGAPVAL